MKSIHFFDRLFIGLVVLTALLLIVRLGAAPIYILDEAKNAQCAREMWDRDDWIVPTFNDILRTDKPVLHYWFMRISYAIGGVGPAQARFFSTILGLLLVVFTYLNVQKHAGKGVAFFSATALVLSAHFIFEFRLSVPDPYLIFFTTLGLFFGYNYLELGKRLSLFATAICLGLAMLAKGPVALALPGLIFLVFILLRKQWKVFRDPYLIVAIALALAVSLPWYYAVHVATDGAFTRGFFLDHNLNRFAAEKEGHGGPFFITAIMVLIGMLPASLPALAALDKKKGYWQHHFFSYSCIVIAVYVIFFSVSNTKLPNYPMPCYPFVAIVAGYFLNDVFTGKQKLPVIIWTVWLMLALAIPVGAFFALKNDIAVSHLSWIAVCLLVLPVAMIVAWLNRSRVVQSFIFIGMGWFLFAGFFLWIGYPMVYNQNPVTKLKPLMEEKRHLIAYKSYNPAFNFNLQKGAYIIPVVQSPDSLKNLLMGYKKETSLPFYLITRLEYLPELTNLGFVEVGRNRDLFELPTTVILKWKP